MNGYNHLKNLNSLAGYAQSKGVPMPKVAVFVSGLMLLLGGLGVLTGVRVSCAATLLAIFLVVTTFKMHQYWKISDPMQRMGEYVNFYKNLALLGGVLLLLSIPTPWVMSLM